MKSKVYNYTEKEFREIIKNSVNFSDCSRKIGFSEKGSNSRRQIKKRCEELNISYEHFYETAAERRKPRPKYELEEILIENSPYTNRTKLKERLVREGKMEYKCAFCGNTGEWNDQPLTLQLDHINGVNDDHRLENLRFLCPNCHSQTETFSGRNLK